MTEQTSSDAAAASGGLFGLAGIRTGDPRPVLERWKAPGLALVVVVILGTLILWPLDITASWEPPFLNLTLQIVFVGAASVFIATLAIRSFLRTGQWPVLWLGAGSLAFGLAMPLSGAVLTWAHPNAAVATHNFNTLLAGMLHCMGAFFLVNDVAAHDSAEGRVSIVLQVFLGLLAVVALVTGAAVAGLFPPLFIPGEGGTPFRQMVVAAATMLFFISGAMFFREYLRTKVTFLFWYSLGLILTTVGLAGILIANALGSPLNWLGRSAQYLAGIYLLIAALVVVGEARVRQMSPDEVLAGFFRGRDANLKLLFDSMSDAIVVTDTQFNITGWNAAAEAMYGWSATEVTGRPVREVLQTTYPPGRSLAESAEELRTKGNWRAEVTQRHRSGVTITVLSSVSLLRDSGGKVIGAVAVERDITERKRGEEEIARLNRTLARRAAELEAANSELEAFAYSVSHDLRAPLRGVDGFSQALLEDYADRLDAEGQTQLRMLRQNAQRMGELIDDLLQFSRLGRQSLGKQHIRVHQVAERAWEELRSDWAGRNVEFLLADLPENEADPGLLKQVYLNLFSNALKFSRTRSPVVIEAGFERPAEGGTVYFVRDNGVGFDMQYVDRIFGVFQRLHRAEEYEGTGVGLAIVHRIIQRHGGELWTESAPGRGAVFYFTLGGGL